MGITGSVGVGALIGGLAALMVGWATRSFATAFSGAEAAVTTSTTIVVAGGCAVVLGAGLLAIAAVLQAGERAGRDGVRE
ncbi:hypothetical protein [Agromyces sp. H66]|uniref:hypothetical protein n=1 Tax=Agromyces sp. H66 TaxID=2529859 RepID=UPI0010AA85EF|nr:hypothetical protein [Agromyces sp. H66]